MLEARFTPRTVFMEVGSPDASLALRAAGYVERVYSIDVSGHLVQNVRAPSNLRIVLCDGIHIPLPRGGDRHRVERRLHGPPSPRRLAVAHGKRAPRPGGRRASTTSPRSSPPWKCAGACLPRASPRCASRCFRSCSSRSASPRSSKWHAAFSSWWRTCRARSTGGCGRKRPRCATPATRCRSSAPPARATRRSTRRSTASTSGATRCRPKPKARSAMPSNTSRRCPGPFFSA